jgi:fimbrial chaperone protein
MQRKLLATGAMITLAASASVALAGSFGISPVGLSLPANRSASSVTIENTGDAPIVIQGHAEAWTQEAGKNVRTASRTLILNPPLFQLAPGEKQLVRVAPRNAPPRETEAAYRAVFTEILPAQGPRQDGLSFRIALAQDIPVYIEPVLPAKRPDVRWEAQRTAEGYRVTAINRGQRHFRLTNVNLSVADAQPQQAGTVVALAQSSFSIEIPVSDVAKAISSIRLLGQLESTEARDADSLFTVDIPLVAAP